MTGVGARMCARPSEDLEDVIFEIQENGQTIYYARMTPAQARDFGGSILDAACECMAEALNPGDLN